MHACTYWPQSEAVSIWTELVNQKKAKLEKGLTDTSTFHSSAVFLSRIQISREQLAEWDASARAWLRTADHAKRIQQTQLRLIVDNISFPVSTESNVHESVMKSWRTAMSALNDLIEGKPQRVQSGALLLALSSWHLYPDISVQSTPLQFVKQADNLVSSGGIITVGLSNDAKHANEGVYWSLPLAHLRVYGKPVVTLRHNGIDQTQVTFDQLACLAMGSMFSTWAITETDLDSAAELLSILAAQRSKIPWLNMMGRVADTYLRSRGSVRDEYARLVAYGRRRCGGFLAEDRYHLPPFFGLAHVPKAFTLFTPNEDPTNRSELGTISDRQVQFLRQWAMSSGLNLSGAVIYYFQNGSSYCTSIFETRTGTKRTSSREEIVSVHRAKHWNANSFDTVDNLETLDKGSLYLSTALGESPVRCEFVYGDPYTAAVYRPSKGKRQRKIDCTDIRPRNLLYLCRDGTFNMKLVLSTIERLDCEAHAPCIQSLRTLEAAAKIYEHLVDARVDLQMCSRSLHASFYSRHLQAQRSKSKYEEETNSQEMISSIKAAFSCITLFQTGHIDIDPEILEGAMAISHGDSIFVAQKILLDPSVTSLECPVRRIIGNVGKPGLVIMIPPQAPEIREKTSSDWRVVNHTPFDGRYENNFASTSMHLAFTGYELPVNVKERGSLNHEAFFVETVVSVYEGGEWVADLDILGSLSNYQHGWPMIAKSGKQKIKIRLVSVDNWHEILDNPESNAIVRACGNRQARLAIATVASQLGYDFRVIGPDDHFSYEPGHLQSPRPGQGRRLRAAGDEDLELEGPGKRRRDTYDPEVLRAMADCDPLNFDDHEESEWDSDQSLDITDMSPQYNIAEPDHMLGMPSDSASVSEADDDCSNKRGVLYIC